MTGRTARFLLSIAVFAVAAALFAPSIAPTHLGLDDWGYTYGCAFVKDGLSLANVASAFSTFGHGGIWMPLTSITYMADISLFGAGWTAHHAVNVALHALTAAVLFNLLVALLARLLPEVRRSHLLVCALATLFWACNPERAEAVAWIASRKEELWSLLALLGVASWVRHIEKGSRLHCFLTLGIFILACLAKPTAVCFPLLAAAAEIFIAGSRPRIVRYIPMLTVALVVGVIAFATQMHPEGMACVELYTAPFWWRLLNAAVATGVYILHAFVPYGVYTDWREIAGGWPLWSAPALATLSIAIAAFAFALRRASDARLKRTLLFAAAWFAISLLPVLGIFGSTGDKALAPRYTYLPTMAFAALLAYGVASISRRRLRFAACLPTALFVAVEAAISLPVTRSYENDRTMAVRTLAFDGDNWRALRTVGRDLATRQGRMDDGIAMIRRSLEIRPSQITVDTLAYLLACRGADGDFAEVRRLAKPAATDHRLDKGGMLLDALGTVAMREGDWPSAVRFYSASISAPNRSYPNLYTMLNLGLSLANAGRDQEAAQVLRRLAATAQGGVRERAIESLKTIDAGISTPFEWK